MFINFRQCGQLVPGLQHVCLSGFQHQLQHEQRSVDFDFDQQFTKSIVIETYPHISARTSDARDYMLQLSSGGVLQTLGALSKHVQHRLRDVQSLRQQLSQAHEELDALRANTPDSQQTQIQLQDVIAKLDEAEKKAEAEQQGRAHAEGQAVVLTKAMKDNALEFEQRLSSLVQEREGLKMELKSSRQQYSEASEVVNAMKAQVQSFQQALKELSSERSGLAWDLKKERERSVQLDVVLQEAQQQMQEANDKLESESKGALALKQQMQQMQEKFSTESSQLQQQLQQAHVQISASKNNDSQVQQLETELQDLKKLSSSKENELLSRISALEQEQSITSSEIEKAEEKNYLSPVYVEELESAKAKAEKKVQELKVQLEKVSSQLQEMKSPKSEEVSSKSQQDSQGSQREYVPPDELRKELNRVTFELKDLQRRDSTAQEVIKEQRERVHELEFELHEMQAQVHSDTAWNRQRMNELETSLNTARADAEQAEELAVQVSELEHQLVEAHEKLAEMHFRHTSSTSIDLSTSDPLERVQELENLVATLKPIEEENQQLRRQLTDLENQRSQLSEEVLQLAEFKQMADQLPVLHDRIKQLEHELQQAKQLHNSDAETQRTIKQLQSELAIKKESSAELKGKYDDLQEIIQSKGQSAEATVSQLKAVTKERDTLVNKIRETKQALAVQKEMSSKQEQDFAEQLLLVSQKASTLQDKVAELQTQLQTKDRYLVQKNQEMEQLKQSHTQTLKTQSQNQQNRVEDLQRQISTLQGEKQQVENTAQESLARYEASASRISELEKLVKELQTAEQERGKSANASQDQIKSMESEIQKLREENSKLQREHDGDKTKIKRALGEMKRKLDQSKEEQRRLELLNAEQRGKNEAEQATLRNDIKHAEELAQSTHTEMTSIQKELQDYKSRAHILLKQKEEEIKHIRNSVGNNEELSGALQASQFEVKQLRQNQTDLQAQIEQVRTDSQAQMDELTTFYEKRMFELESSLADSEKRAERIASESQEWQKRASDLESQLTQLQFSKSLQSHERLSTMSKSLEQDQSKRIEELEMRIQGLQQDFQTYRDTNERMSEAKEEEVQRLLEKNAVLRSQLAVASQASLATSGELGEQTSLEIPKMENSQPLREADIIESVLSGQDFQQSSSFQTVGQGGILGSILQETQPSESSQFIELAQRQAERDEALEALRRQKEQLEEEVREYEKEVQLRAEQERVLKQALREIEMNQLQVKSTNKGGEHGKNGSHTGENGQENEQVDLQYLKNVIIKMMETNQAEALLPVISTLLGFSSEELQHCKDTLARQKQEEEVPLPGAAAAVDMGLQYSQQLFSWAFRPSR